MAHIQEPRHTRALLRKMGVRDRSGFDRLDDTIYPMAGVDPNIAELASAVHSPNGSAGPVRGIQWDSFNVVNPTTPQQLISTNLTQGLYEIQHLITATFALNSAVTLGVQLPSGTSRSIAYHYQGFASFRTVQPITVYLYIDEPWNGTLPVIGITLATGGTGSVLGFLSVRRCWTDGQD